MYYCQKCDKLSNPGEVATKVVTKTRNKEYVNEDFFGEKVYSQGWEIVEEQLQCADCAKEKE